MSMLIEEKDVTAVNLAVELERAVVQHALEDDGGIYVTEDSWFPFWIRIQPNNGYVILKTYTQFKRATTLLQRLELSNELNVRNYLVTSSVTNDLLHFDYILNYRDGLLRETFVRSCRQFARNLGKGLEMVDPDNDFILPPGKREPEPEDEEAP